MGSALLGWQTLLPVFAIVAVPAFIGWWHARAKGASSKRTAAIAHRLGTRPRDGRS